MNDVNKFFEGWDSGINSEVEHLWRENEKERILVFKLSSDTPLDIKIKDHTITVKGEVKERVENKSSWGNTLSTSIYRFQYGPFPLPSDINPEEVKVEKKDKDGELLIRFPKVKAAQKRPLPQIPLPPGKRVI